MAFDGIITCAMVKELQDKIYLGKIEKVYQPENDELVFHIHTKTGNVKLFASVGSAHARLHFIEENPKNPPVLWHSACCFANICREAESWKFLKKTLSGS